MTLQRYDTPAMAAWAHEYIKARPDPDFTVYDPTGLPQLQRWYLVPRNDVANVYLHRFLRSDEDRALHDHRGDNRSWLLYGSYIEHTGYYRNDSSLYQPAGQIRSTGDVISRKGLDLYRIELIDEQPVLSLFFIGPIDRDWGFACPQGWRPWQKFVEEMPNGNGIGKGCG